MDGVVQNEGTKLSVQEGGVLTPIFAPGLWEMQKEQVTLEALALELTLLEFI